MGKCFSFIVWKLYIQCLFFFYASLKKIKLAKISTFLKWLEIWPHPLILNAGLGSSSQRGVCATGWISPLSGYIIQLYSHLIFSEYVMSSHLCKPETKMVTLMTWLFSVIQPAFEDKSLYLYLLNTVMCSLISLCLRIHLT